MSGAFLEPVGQGWAQIGSLAVAFVLSLAIGIEREMLNRSAGIRTYTLVGLGAALFVLFSKYGFTDVLGPHVTLDPSRVAAQIVTGVGFIGGGLIFVRRDAVRGLTTAASVWLTAAIGAAAGGGLPVLAAAATGMYFVVVYGLRPLARLVSHIRHDTVELHIGYRDGHGALREIIAQVTTAGFAVSNLATIDRGGAAERPSDAAADGTARVRMTLTGAGDPSRLLAELIDLPGVVSAQVDAAAFHE